MDAEKEEDYVAGWMVGTLVGAGFVIVVLLVLVVALRF
jgi:hypothetical protein